MRMTWEQDDTVGQIYDEIKDAYDDLRRLRELSRATPVIGPLTFILALALAIYAGYQSAAKESEIAQLKWEAEIMKGYAKQTQRERTAKMNEAKSIYDEEVAGASEAEVQAARVRFYRTAAEIVGRMDIVNDIDQMKRSGTLDSKIEDAVKRQIDPQTKHIIREHSW